MSRIRPLFVVSLAAIWACSRTPPATTPTPSPGGAAGQRGAAPAAAVARGPGDSTATPAAGNGGRGGAAGEPNPQPYGRVIRGEVKTRSGLFKTHQIGPKLYFEIPQAELGKVMLVTTEIEKTVLGAGYGGQAIGSQVVKFERQGNRILLRSENYGITSSDTTNPVTIAVNNANFPPIIKSFNVESWGPDSSAVIDVTDLFKNPPTELGISNAYKGGIDGARSFLVGAAPYPQNIVVRSDLTINTTPAAAGAGRGASLPPSATFRVHWSIVKLPETPMMPRLFDSRVGYFSNRTTDFGLPVQRSEPRTFIARYRLECSDRKVGNLCVPKKPIVYYVDPATPTWLVPWVKKAIADWQPAFEAAGFYQAIQAKEAPSKAEDPDWSPEDARYSVIDWLPSTTENAVGPHTSDPRSGEIISAHLQIYHNVMNLTRDWYWVQVGALDPRARVLPLPDSLQGRLMEYVVAHEIGHSLGFQHNMKASATYPVDSLRSASFVRRMGHTPTLMDYSRFNYVAQPEDGIALEDLIPRIGPYDIWATMWGYKPIPGTRTPDDERPTLDQWAREQDAKPWLRFSTSDAGSSDPGNNTEAVGDADAVKATGWGLLNIKRLIPMLVPATTARATNDYSELRELYTRLIGQWSTEMRHVAVIPGSLESQEKYISQPGPRYTPTSAARQRAAVKFLVKEAFNTPSYFIVPDILEKIEPEGAITRITAAQSGVLGTLLSTARLSRMVEIETVYRPSDIYPLPDYLADIRKGVWSELSSGGVRIDPYRRGLQQAWLTLVVGKVNPPPPPSNAAQGAQAPATPADIQAIMRAELRTLDGQVAAAQGRAGDAMTRAHLANVRHQIDEALNPKK